MTGMMATTTIIIHRRRLGITIIIHRRRPGITIPSPRHITTVSLRPSLTAMASLLRDRTVRTDTVSFT